MMAEVTQAGQVIIEVDERTFEREVIERSREVPVVVDFWAPWCGPCRMLGPVLEGLAREYGGRFVLAKVNTDENRQLALRYGIQGIPAVKAFKDGEVVAEFVGAQPQPMVRQFIEGLLPNELDEKVQEGLRLLAENRPADAECRFREVLSQQPDHPGALLGMGRAQIALGQVDAGLKTLSLIPETLPEAREAERIRREVEMRRELGDVDEAALRARLAETPADVEARYQLAMLLTSRGDYEEALQHFLEVIRRDRKYKDDGARKMMLYIFDQMGDHHPLTRKYRNQLAMALFA